MSLARDFFDQHEPRLQRALAACASREYWSPFIESPSRKRHPEGAKDRGRAGFEAALNKSFALPDHPGEAGGVRAIERSPYTGEALGTSYPRVDPDALFQAMHIARGPLALATKEERVGLCLEMLERLHQDVFRNAFATMHTAGQAFMMAFAGSGANSLDRGLEGLAYAHRAMQDVPERATFTRTFGKHEVTLEKSYRLIPRGVACVISCGSYPAWNAYPAIFANLATGNAVVVKPHPRAVLPMAFAVSICRDVLREAGFDENVITLAADTTEDPITFELMDRAQLIDFTGSQRFGAIIEERYAHKLVYTETAGCNAVVIDSTEDYRGMCRAIAHSFCIFSSQMCTAAQNVFIPERVATDEGDKSAEVVARDIAKAVDEWCADPAKAAAICGAVQTQATLDEMAALAKGAGDNVARPSSAYAHPDYPNAQVATPLLVHADARDTFYRREFFGPMGFLIRCKNRDHALVRATEDARSCGAIASYAYTVDPRFAQEVEESFAFAGASVGFNLIQQLPINYAAAYSDFHVSGLNPAGNACLTDLAFVASRFRVVQSKRELPSKRKPQPKRELSPTSREQKEN